MVSARRALGPLLVLLGVGLLTYGAMQGSVRVGLFLIVPYVYGTGLLPFLGMALIMAGAFVWMTSRFTRLPEGEHDGAFDPEAPRRASWEPAAPPADDGGMRTRRRAKHGGFVLVGPIPIVWGSDKRMLPWLILLGFGLVVLMLLLPALLR